MASAEHTATKVDKMGERPVQVCVDKMAQTEIQRKPPIICPLGIGTSIKIEVSLRGL